MPTKMPRLKIPSAAVLFHVGLTRKTYPTHPSQLLNRQIQKWIFENTFLAVAYVFALIFQKFLSQMQQNRQNFSLLFIYYIFIIYLLFILL